MGVSTILLQRVYDTITRYLRAYAVMLPAALNVFSMQGFLILNCIVGGQTLASVSNHIDDTLGIVVISLIAMIVSVMQTLYIILRERY